MKKSIFICLFVFQHRVVSANPRFIRPAPITSACAPSPTPNFLFAGDELRRRQASVNDITCGYSDGDVNRPGTAGPGFNCRVDTKNGIWGFCPTTVIAATDCGFPGFCIDQKGCSNGCGPLPDRTDITTRSWYVLSSFSPKPARFYIQ
jgi:hypothetical protein